MASKKTSSQKNAPIPGTVPAKRRPKVQLPPGVEMKDLSDSQRPAGFLVTPTDENRTPTTFVGVLRALNSKQDPTRPDKPNVWGVFEAVGNQDCEVFDRTSGELIRVTDGMLVGLSRKGAIKGMTEDKVGHLFAFEFTGKQVKLDKGRNPMWECHAQYSAEPYLRHVS